MHDAFIFFPEKAFFCVCEVVTLILFFFFNQLYINLCGGKEYIERWQKVTV